MKKRLATQLLVFAAAGMLLVGCGAAGKAESDGSSDLFQKVSEEESGAGTEENENGSQSEGDAKAGTDSDAAAAADNNAGAKAPDAGDAGQSEAGADASFDDLYEAFKGGQVGAKYTGKADKASYIELKNVLKAGESYTLSEISEKLAGYEDYSFKADGDAAYRLIDCGSDGNKELLVSQGYVSDAMGGEVTTLLMIIKDMGGELDICYDEDMWSRSDVKVNDNGTIIGSGSGGAALHIYECAYVDAAGEYHYHYGSEENTTPYGQFYYYKDGDYTEVPLDGLDTEHLVINSYYFDDDLSKRTDYVSFNMIDDNFNPVFEDGTYSDSNEIVKRFKEYGIEIYTPMEMEAMLNKHGSEIGYPY
ncbi:MAG: hypothetical protein IJ695_07895 [Butyrivibrio sp.]|nr:hypothetical protein [Butyrivibrio sp.]